MAPPPPRSSGTEHKYGRDQPTPNTSQDPIQRMSRWGGQITVKGGWGRSQDMFREKRQHDIRDNRKTDANRPRQSRGKLDQTFKPSFAHTPGSPASTMFHLKSQISAAAQEYPTV
jgi:hypothetical protein